MGLRTDTTLECDTCPFEELLRPGMNLGWRFFTISLSPKPGTTEQKLTLCPTCAAPVEGAIKPKRAK